MKSTLKTMLLASTVMATIAFTISSCGKKENQAPVITINEPADNETVTIPDSMHLEGLVTDDNSLHELSVLIIKSTGDTALQEYPYVHDLKSYIFHYHFHPSSVGTYTLKVTAEDHDAKSTTATRSITVM